MLKARAGDTVFFGLSARNLELLRAGRPIKIDLQDIGMTGTAIIFYGETEEKMRDDLLPLVGAGTIYHDALGTIEKKDG